MAGKPDRPVFGIHTPKTAPDDSGLTRTGDVDLPLVEQDESSSAFDDLFGGVADALDDAQTIPENQALADADGDGLNAIDESFLGTDPDDADSDNDKISDRDEVRQGTNPLAADTDDDGLTDLQEQRRGTDPLSSDTDRDGISDVDDRFATVDGRAEVEAGRAPPVLDNGPPPPPPVSAIDADEITGNETEASPTLEGVLEQDRDGDGLSDAQERILGTDPDDADTDDDLVPDGVEVAEKSDPTVREFDLEVPGLPTFDNRPPPENPLDNLLDDLENAPSPGDVTEQLNRDSDGDGVTDISEITSGTNPNDTDSDNDGLDDGRETQLGTNPNSRDTDGDGVNDRREVRRGTDPTNADTDGDGQSDRVDLTPTVASSTLSNDLQNGLAAPTIEGDPVRAARAARRARRESRGEDEERSPREAAARDQPGTVATETPIPDGTSNTIIIGEEQPARQPIEAIPDGTSNTIIIGEEQPPRQPIEAIPDGSSNTIIIGEEQPAADPVKRPAERPGTATDGTSNTIAVEEEKPPTDPAKRAPTPPPTQDEAVSTDSGDRLTGSAGSGQEEQPPTAETAPAIDVIDDDPDEQFGSGRTTDPVAERTFVPPSSEAAPATGAADSEDEDEDADEVAFGDGRAAAPLDQADGTSPPDEGTSPADPPETTQGDGGFLPTEAAEPDEDDDDDD